MAKHSESLDTDQLAARMRQQHETISKTIRSEGASQQVMAGFADAYRAWLEATTGEKIDGQTERFFNLNVVAAFSEAQLHPFIKTLDRTLEGIAQEYEAAKGARLFSDEPELNLLKKSFASALDKSFRLNVIKNRKRRGGFSRSTGFRG